MSDCDVRHTYSRSKRQCGIGRRPTGAMRWTSAVLLAVVVNLVLAARSEAVAPPAISPGAHALTDAQQCLPTAFAPCPQDPPSTQGGGGILPGLSLSYTWASCLAPVTDSDGDGLDDGCEMALASAFAPLLMVDTSDCNWDGGLNRLGGEYYYGVKRRLNNQSIIRIGYLPAYYSDCGSEPHTGDSEFILVDVTYNTTTTRWTFQGAFLSAHCGAEFLSFSSDPDCQFWGHEYWDGGSVHDGLVSHASGGYVEAIKRGAPIVWVPTGKHGNYYSLDKCNNSQAAQVGVDLCPELTMVSRRFPVTSNRWQNIDFPESGVWAPFGPRWGSTSPTPGATEEFNEGGDCSSTSTNCYVFNGWLRPSSGGGATRYGDLIRRYFDWWVTTVSFPPCSAPHNAFQPCGRG